MPPKKVRYRVLVKDPLLNSWRYITGPLTETDANKLMGMLSWVTKKESWEDDYRGS